MIWLLYVVVGAIGGALWWFVLLSLNKDIEVLDKQIHQYKAATALINESRKLLNDSTDLREMALRAYHRGDLKTAEKLINLAQLTFDKSKTTFDQSKIVYAKATKNDD